MTEFDLKKKTIGKKLLKDINNTNKYYTEGKYYYPIGSKNVYQLVAGLSRGILPIFHRLRTV